MTTKDNEQPPELAPSEPKGRLVEEPGPAAAVSEVPALAPSAPVLHEQTSAPELAPSEPKGQLVEDGPAPSLRGFSPPILVESTHQQEPAASEPKGELVEGPAAPQQARAGTPETTRRIVGIPARPRVRVSYWFEGDALKCEAVLLDETRRLVHRTQFEPTDDPVIAQGFAYYAGRLVAELKKSGAVVTIPATPAPAAQEPTEPSAEPTGAERGAVNGEQKELREILKAVPF